MTDYRILITGSRDWDDPAKISYEMGLAIGQSGASLGDVVIVHGACRAGADAIADRIARDYGYRIERHPADWRPDGKLDRSAGYRRNAEMVALGADVMLAFIRDDSAGATHCATMAAQAGIETRRYTADG